MIDGYGAAPAEVDAAGAMTARWDADAALPLTGMARAVSAFAGTQGMRQAALRRLETVVSHAVAACLDVGAQEQPRMTVEAATDGAWLSVRVTGDAAWHPERTTRRLAVASALTERLEIGRPDAADGTVVLMELRMAAA